MPDWAQNYVLDNIRNEIRKRLDKQRQESAMLADHPEGYDDPDLETLGALAGIVRGETTTSFGVDGNSSEVDDMVNCI